MAQVKPLFYIPGGFKQVAATDQVAMDGGLVTVTETGASSAKALPDALAGKFNNTGGAVGYIQAGDPADADPYSFVAVESTNGASKRARYLIGSGWEIGQDSAQNGTKDFYVYGPGGNAITADATTSQINFALAPTVGGNAVPAITVNAAFYGYKTGTNTDMGPAMQAAVNAAAAAGGGVIIVPAGTAYFDTAIDVTGANYVWIQGSGLGTYWVTRSTGNALVQTTGGINSSLQHFALTNIRMSSIATRTAAPFLNFDMMLYNCVIQDIQADNWGSLLRIASFEECYIWRVRAQQMASPPAGGYCFQLGTNGLGRNTGANLSIVGCLLRGNTAGSNSSNWTNGIIINNVEAISTKALDVGTFDRGVFIDPDFAANNFFFEDTYFDSTYNAECLLVTNTGNCLRWTFSNCWFATSSGQSGTYGTAPLVQVGGSGICQDWVIGTSRFYNAGGHGVYITNAHGLQATFNGCEFQDIGSGSAGGNTYSHVYVTNGNVANPVFAGCTFVRCTSVYAIVIQGGATISGGAANFSDKPFFFGSAPTPSKGGPIEITRGNDASHVWDIDTSPVKVTIANGAYYLFQAGSGLVVLDNAATGSVALYLCGGGSVNLLASSGGGYGGGTNAGTVNMAYSSPSNAYYVNNQTGATVTLSLCAIRTRATA